MIFLKILLLGAIAGVTAFLPLSSAGAVMLFGRLLQIQMDQRLFTFLMLGLFLAMVTAFFNDLVRLVYSLGGICGDLLFNFRTYLRVRGRETDDYRRILTGNYRNFLVLLLTALVPVVLLSLLLGRAVQYAYGSFLTIGMGYFITAVILLVSSYMVVPEKGPRQMKPQEALILGCFQGAAFIPGISKIAAAASGGFLCGNSRRLAVKFAYLLSIISLLMSMLPGSVHPVFAGVSAAGLPYDITAFAGAFAAGSLLIRRAQGMISKENNRIFAGCNVVFGMAALLAQLLQA